MKELGIFNSSYKGFDLYYPKSVNDFISVYTSYVNDFRIIFDTEIMKYFYLTASLSKNLLNFCLKESEKNHFLFSVLFFMYKDGLGVQKNERTACEFLMKGITYGDGFCYFLASYHINDIDAKEEYLIKSFDSGYENASYPLYIQLKSSKKDKNIINTYRERIFQTYNPIIIYLVWKITSDIHKESEIFPLMLSAKMQNVWTLPKYDLACYFIEKNTNIEFALYLLNECSNICNDSNAAFKLSCLYYDGTHVEKNVSYSYDLALAAGNFGNYKGYNQVLKILYDYAIKNEVFFTDVEKELLVNNSIDKNQAFLTKIIGIEYAVKNMMKADKIHDALSDNLFLKINEIIKFNKQEAEQCYKLCIALKFIEYSPKQNPNNL